jgi:putative ABC transport system permease protein
MNLFSIAWKSIRQRLLSSSLTALSVALGVALMIAVLIINGVIGQMFNQTGTGYDLVIGPRGSHVQLILSTIYRIDRPIENLPWRFYQEMLKRPEVEKAIPIALGDATEVGQFPIVGTTTEYLTTPYGGDGKRFRMMGDGRVMSGAWEAVIGSEVARTNNWKAGDDFRMIHGGQDDHVHDERFTITGVLDRTNTPNDRSVFVNLEGFLSLGGHEKPLVEAIQSESAFFGDDISALQQKYAKEIAAEADARARGVHYHPGGTVPEVQRQITSIVVVCKGGDDLPRRGANAMSLQTFLRKGYRAEAANPVLVMKRLMDGLLNNVRLAVLVLTALIILVSGIGIFVSIYNSMADRRREIGIMRALGARRQTVFSIVLAESLLLCVGGGLLGILLGHGLVVIGSPIVAARSGLVINPAFFDPMEFVIVPVMVLMATLVGFLPALTAYRTDVAQALAN